MICKYRGIAAAIFFLMAGVGEEPRGAFRREPLAQRPHFKCQNPQYKCSLYAILEGGSRLFIA